MRQLTKLEIVSGPIAGGRLYVEPDKWSLLTQILLHIFED